MTAEDARCDRHVGEAYPPRCGDCDIAREEAAHPANTDEQQEEWLRQHPESREVALAMTAMLTGTLTGAARPREVLADALPDGGPAEVWGFVGDLVDMLAHIAAGSIRENYKDPLAFIRGMTLSIPCER